MRPCDHRAGIRQLKLVKYIRIIHFSYFFACLNINVAPKRPENSIISPYYQIALKGRKNELRRDILQGLHQCFFIYKYRVIFHPDAVSFKYLQRFLVFKLYPNLAENAQCLLMDFFNPLF